MNPKPSADTIRAFLSINLPAEVRETIGNFQDTLRSEVRGIRWTRPENCHFTLKFLGDTPIEVLPKIEQALNPLLKDLGCFSLELYGVGQFPPKGAPSVVWIGVNRGSSAIALLEDRIREGLHASEIGFDKKTFKAHLTIGRAIRNQRASVWALKHYSEHSFGTFEVKGVSLMQSVLQHDGPVYSERIHFPLA